MEEFVRQIIAAVAPYFITFVVTMVGLVLTMVTAWLKNKIKSEKADNAISMVEDAVYDVVQHMEQTVRPMLSDGKLSDQERQLIKTKALKRLKENLSPQVVKALQMVTGDMEKYLETKMEATIHRLKRRESL